jgi:hypothetical protein
MWTTHASYLQQDVVDRKSEQRLEISNYRKKQKLVKRKAELNRVKLDLGTERTSWTVQKKTKQTKDEYSPLDESLRQQTQKI